MHRKDELKKSIVNMIQNYTDFAYDEKEIWTAIFSEMADFQEEMLRCIADGESGEDKKAWNIHCGVTSLEEKKIGKNRYFISVADDITADDFPYGNIDSDSRVKKDGDWFIIGTGYMDCEYEELHRICGRDKLYKGITSYGEFEYSIILQNNILNMEKLLYKVAQHYNIDAPVIYAPMLRRLVYIETKSEIKGNIREADLRLEKNGLSCLLGGWRAVWNVEITDSPYGTKCTNGYKYVIEKNEYIVPIDKYESEIHISRGYDSEKKQDYVTVVSDMVENPKKYILKLQVYPINSEKDIESNDIKSYMTRGKNPDISHIYSQSDVFSFLESYSDVLECMGVYTHYPEDLTVCAYESGFEYPIYPEYFRFSGRPVIYVSFRKDSSRYFYDRIVYVTHILQRKFPEYIWKGGYFR